MTEREEGHSVATGPPACLAFPEDLQETILRSLLFPLSRLSVPSPSSDLPMSLPRCYNRSLKDALGKVHPGFERAQLGPQLQMEVPEEDI